MPAERIASGLSRLDALLGGGFDRDALTELYGEGGSGKTQLCLHLAVRVALGGDRVLYIDTEGLSLDRLEAVSGGRLAEVLDRMLISSPVTLEEQSRAVRTASDLARSDARRVGLIVLDSATRLYRLTLDGEGEDDGRQALLGQLADLQSLALRSSVPTLFTNQVWRDPRTGQLEPLGGSFVNHGAKTILRIERLPGARRRAVLVKHRARPEGSAEFEITATGLA